MRITFLLMQKKNSNKLQPKRKKLLVFKDAFSRQAFNQRQKKKLSFMFSYHARREKVFFEVLYIYLAAGSGVALGLGDGTGDTLLLLGLSECREFVD